MASLSGAADAQWAKAGAPYVGAAFLGGIALCEPTRTAARELVARDREEFLPADPFAFIDRQLRALADVDLRPAVNVRATTTEAVAAAAGVCNRHDAILELNAHCRQEEMCAVGAGETLLSDTDRLAAAVRAAAPAPAVSVKVRAEVPNVDLTATARAIEAAGATAIHVDAMDSEAVIADVAEAADLFLIANNGVRGRASVEEYVAYGADAVSVGRPSDRPAVLERVRDAAERCFEGDDGHPSPDDTRSHPAVNAPTTSPASSDGRNDK